MFKKSRVKSTFLFFELILLTFKKRNGLIKLQNYKQENPNRMFISFEGLEIILKGGVDNRELIPDFFCYFDIMNAYDYFEEKI